MNFGIKKGSSKTVTLEDIQQKLVEKEQINHIELFINVCYELAAEKSLDAVIYLDHSYIYNAGNLDSEKTLNVKFRKI